MAGEELHLDAKYLNMENAAGRLPCPPPFRAVYEKNGRKLTFFAALHSVDAPQKAGVQFKAIEAELAQKPSHVLVELETGGVIPKEVAESMKASCSVGGVFRCDEAQFTVVAAHDRGIAVTGAEPIPPALYDGLKASLTRTELLAFRSAQAVLMLKREGVPPAAWAEQFNSYVKRDLPFADDEWSYEKFAEWAKVKMGAPLAEVNPDWIAPVAAKGARPLQKIAYRVDQVREPLIIANAEKVIRTHPSVLVVYGANHFLKDAPVYERAFGAPRVECFR